MFTSPPAPRSASMFRLIVTSSDSIAPPLSSALFQLTPKSAVDDRRRRETGLHYPSSGHRRHRAGAEELGVERQDFVTPCIIKSPVILYPCSCRPATTFRALERDDRYFSTSKSRALFRWPSTLVVRPDGVRVRRRLDGDVRGRLLVGNTIFAVKLLKRPCTFEDVTDLRRLRLRLVDRVRDRVGEGDGGLQRGDREITGERRNARASWGFSCGGPEDSGGGTTRKMGRESAQASSGLREVTSFLQVTRPSRRWTFPNGADSLQGA